MKTVLIFSYECAPYNNKKATIGAQRVAQFAKHLPKFGWRALVLCRDFNYGIKYKNLNKNIIIGAIQNISNTYQEESSIIFPLKDTCKIGYIEHLWQYLYFKNSKKLIQKNVRKILTFKKYFTGDYSESWQRIAKIAAKEIQNNYKIDCCIGENSPDAGIYLARWFSKKYNIPWIIDSRDPLLLPYQNSARRIKKIILKWQIKSAKALINVNPIWTKKEEIIFKKKALTVTNGFDKEEFSVDSKISEYKKLKLLYAGNINAGSVNPLNGIKCLFSGISILENEFMTEYGNKCEFIFYGYGKNIIKELSIDYNIEKNVLINSPIERNKILKKMKSSHILVIFSVSEIKNEDEYYRHGFYPGKLFEYFGAKRKILCIPGDKGGLLDKILRDTRTGVCLDSPFDVCEYLKKEINKLKNTEYSFDFNRHEINKYTRENQTKKLALLLNKII